MSKERITFVATGELAAFLDKEAQRRLTTVSSAAQQLLSESYLRDHPASGSATSVDSELEVLQRHSDKIDFRGLESKHPFRVELPDGFEWGRNYEYFEEREAAAKALKRWYE